MDRNQQKKSVAIQLHTSLTNVIMGANSLWPKQKDMWEMEFRGSKIKWRCSHHCWYGIKISSLVLSLNIGFNENEISTER